MERVTKKDTDGHYYMTGDGIFSDWSVPEKFKGEEVDTIGAIENILGNEYELDRLRELVEADRDGKIPKYTIGDTVYDSFGNAWEVTAVELHSMRTKNECLYRCGHEGTDDYHALWYFEAFPSKEAALRREQNGNRI